MDRVEAWGTVVLLVVGAFVALSFLGVAAGAAVSHAIESVFHVVAEPF